MKVLILFALVALAVASASVIGPLGGAVAVGHLGVPVAAAVPVVGLGGAVVAGHGLGLGLGHGIHGIHG